MVTRSKASKTARKPQKGASKKKANPVETHRYTLSIPGTGRVTIVINVPRTTKAPAKKKRSHKPDDANPTGGGIYEITVNIGVTDPVADEGNPRTGGIYE